MTRAAERKRSAAIYHPAPLAPSGTITLFDYRQATSAQLASGFTDERSSVLLRRGTAICFSSRANRASTSDDVDGIRIPACLPAGCIFDRLGSFHCSPRATRATAREKSSRGGFLAPTGWLWRIGHLRPRLR